MQIGFVKCICEFAMVVFLWTNSTSECMMHWFWKYPQIFVLKRSLYKYCFKFVRLPSLLHFTFVLTMEVLFLHLLSICNYFDRQKHSKSKPQKNKVLHTVGLAVLVFLAFPDLDSARVLMLTARFSSSSSWSNTKIKEKQETITISRHLQRWSNIIIILEALQLCQPVFSCSQDFRRTTIGKGKHTNSWPWCKWSSQEWQFKITTAQIHFVQ